MLGIEDYEGIWNYMTLAFVLSRAQQDNKRLKDGYIAEWQRKGYDLIELKAAIYEIVDSKHVYLPSFGVIYDRMLSIQARRDSKRVLDEAKVDPDAQAKIRAIIGSLFQSGGDPLRF